MPRALPALLTALALLAGPAVAEADGPDAYRVAGVAAGGMLNLRVGPGTDHAVLAGIPPRTDGLMSFGCAGGPSYAEWAEATEAEREDGRAGRWCLIGFDRTVGWAAGWFLAEGDASADAFGAGERLASLADTEWRMTRLGAAPTEGPDLAVDRSLGVSGTSGCNRFVSGLEAGPGTLTFGPVAGTRMACPDARATLEAEVLAAFAATARAVATERVLALVAEDGRVLAQYARVDAD